MNIAQMLNDSIRRRKQTALSEQKKKSDLKKGTASIGQPSMKGQPIEPNQKGTVTKTPIKSTAPAQGKSCQMESWTATSSGYPVYDIIPPAPYSKDYMVKDINKSVAEAGGLARPQEQKGRVIKTPIRGVAGFMQIVAEK
jgi:hypothetical protein